MSTLLIWLHRMMQGPRAELPMITPKQPQQRGKPSIPETLRIKPDEGTLKLEQQKAKLIDALQPDEATVTSVRSSTAACCC